LSTQGDSSFINDGNVFPLIALTNYYGIHSLKELCGELLSAIIDGDNLFYLLDLRYGRQRISLSVCFGADIHTHNTHS
jgi:hypothetical protein